MTQETPHGRQHTEDAKEQQAKQAETIKQGEAAKGRVREALSGANKFDHGFITIDYDRFFGDLALAEEGSSLAAKNREGARWGSLRKAFSGLDQGLLRDILPKVGREDYIHGKLWEYLDRAKSRNNKADIQKGLRAFRALGYDRVQEGDYGRFLDDLSELDSKKLLEVPEKPEDELEISKELRKHYEFMGLDPEIRKQLVISKLQYYDQLDNSKKVLQYLNVADKLGYWTRPEMKLGLDKLKSYHEENARQEKEAEDKTAQEEAQRRADAEAADRQRDREEAQRASDAEAESRRRERDRQAERDRARQEQEAADRRAHEESTEEPLDSSGETTGEEQPAAPEPEVPPSEPGAVSTSEAEDKSEEVLDYLESRWKDLNPSSGVDRTNTMNRFTTGLTLLNEWIVKRPGTVTAETMKAAMSFFIRNIWPENMPLPIVRSYTKIPEDNQVIPDWARILYKGVGDLSPFDANKPRGREDKRLAREIDTRLRLFNVSQIDPSDARLLEITQKLVEIFSKVHDVVDSAGYFR